MSLVKKLSFIFTKLIIIYLFVGLIYLVYGLNNKLNKYDITNDVYVGDIEVSYHENSNSFYADKNNNSV